MHQRFFIMKFKYYNIILFFFLLILIVLLPKSESFYIYESFDNITDFPFNYFSTFNYGAGSEKCNPNLDCSWNNATLQYFQTQNYSCYNYNRSFYSFGNTDSLFFYCKEDDAITSTLIKAPNNDGFMLATKYYNFEVNSKNMVDKLFNMFNLSLFFDSNTLISFDLGYYCEGHSEELELSYCNDNLHGYTYVNVLLSFTLNNGTILTYNIINNGTDIISDEFLVSGNTNMSNFLFNISKYPELINKEITNLSLTSFIATRGQGADWDAHNCYTHGFCPVTQIVYLDNMLITNEGPIVNNSLPYILSTAYNTQFPGLYQTVYLFELGADDEDDHIFWAHTCNAEEQEFGVSTIADEDMESGTAMDLLSKMTYYNTTACYSEYEYLGVINHNAWNMTISNNPPYNCSQTFDFKYSVTNTSGTDTRYVSNNIYYTFKDSSSSSTNDSIVYEAWDNSNVPIYSIIINNDPNGGVSDPPNTRKYYFFNPSTLQYELLHQSLYLENYYAHIRVDMDFTLHTVVVKIDDNDDAVYEYVSSAYQMWNNNSRQQYQYFATLAGFDATTITLGGSFGTHLIGGFNIIETIVPQFSGPYPIQATLLSAFYPYHYQIECAYDTIGLHTIRIYLTDAYHPNEVNNYFDYDLIVQGTSVNESANASLSNSSIPYAGDFNDSLFEPPSETTCNVVCQFLWFMGFPSRLSKMADSELTSSGYPSATYQTISNGVAFSVIIFAIIMMVTTYEINKTVIATWFYTLVHMFVGYMPMYVFIFMTFLLAIVLAAWKRSMETGLGGRISGGADTSEQYTNK